MARRRVNMNFNPMQMMQMMRGGGNPQQMLMNILNQQAGNNPVLQNALKMAQDGDAKGIETLARNLAKEKGIDADKAVEQLKGQFGMK